MESMFLAIAMMTAPLEGGSLIFIEHGMNVIERVTDSTITHVAITVNEGGKIWVYESTPPKVRRVTLEDYYAEIQADNEERQRKGKPQMRMWVMRPNKPYSKEKLGIMKSYLDKQIGKRYSILDYILKRPTEGYHCSELVAHALTHLGIIKCDKPCAESPKDVIKSVANQYLRPIEVCRMVAPAK